MPIRKGASMEIIVVPDYESLSKRTAMIISEELKIRPDLVIGLAAGGTYRELVRMHTEEGLDFPKVTTFNLDEYIGFNPAHPSSYSSFMWENLFSHINVNPSNVYIPCGDTADSGEFCRWYEDKIEQSGGIDIQLLGIGGEGHIWFQ